VKHAPLVLLLLFGALPAAAAPCNTPELLATFPPEGARGITTDATLSAAYASSADYLGEEVLLVPDGGEPRPVPAIFDRAESLLSIKPEPLTPGLGYSVRWPGLRGVDTATPGLGREVHFFAGAGPDQEPPTFFGLGGATWDLSRERSNCSDDIEDRFVFDLDLGVAGDDGGRDALALMVFQTAGRNTLGPVPVLVRPIPESVVRVELPASLAAGHVCFSAQVRDLTGKVSAPSLNQTCVETTSPPFFRGCAAGGRGGGGIEVLGLLGLLGIWRWRRR
jgi:MYXO-CTERM domain-containing protein